MTAGRPVTLSARIRGLVRTVWTDGKVDRLPRYLHPGVRLSNGDESLTMQGIDEVHAAIRAAREPFDRYDMCAHHVVEQGGVVAWRWTVRARLASGDSLGGDLRTLAGQLDELRWVGFSGMTFSTFDGGLITEQWTESNAQGLLQQLGASAS